MQLLKLHCLSVTDMKDSKSLVIVAFQSFWIHGKHFKCSANIYLVHLEELYLTSNKKVSVLTFKYEKVLFLPNLNQLTRDVDTSLHLFVLIASVIHRSYTRRYP